ncbi:MAG: cysteine--tRNA ligase [Robiginitomaculum sp.]|nr:cysteine--tRNA ligase [Robiginitomaculum sp.]
MMELTLYNSLKREKQVFKPMNPKRVTMYNCGPTVYSYAHIGNARAAVVADVLFRVLRHIYGEDHVVYARNLTDVDDKIIKAAKELGVPISEITEKYAKIYQDDLAALNCLPPTSEPKATEHIGGMIDLIKTLLKDGYAYESDGHVFFDVSKYDEYGQLSGNTLDALKKGDRVGEGEVARKKNAADFVLWKPELDGVGWDAPFGKGRPGWHIECSAMAKSELGETIDIHCGGVDLKFPHHENEIAQSNCAHGKPMANYWVHNEFLNMGKDKMSKSLGNIVLVHDLLKDWDGEVIRLALLKAHYRSELVWSEDLLRESKKNLDDCYRVIKKTIRLVGGATKILKQKYDFNEIPKGHSLELRDDLNTPDALKFMLERAGTLNACLGLEHIGDANGYLKDLKKVGDMLGLLQKDSEEWFRGEGKEGGLSDEAIENLIVERAEVRAQKNWARADEIRDIFKAENIILEDGKTGTTWRRG